MLGGIVIIFFWLVSLGVSLYVLMLATRFVNAVETIAARMRQ